VNGAEAAGLREAESQPVGALGGPLGEADEDLAVRLPEARERLRPVLAREGLELPGAQRLRLGAAEENEQRQRRSDGTTEPLCDRPTPFGGEGRV